MNIFLLFLTTLFMIGYYVLYSPSQHVIDTTTEDVVRMSDLRAIAECVIGMENAKMNSEDYNDPCVARYKVVGGYVCANSDDNGNIKPAACYENEPEFNFIVSYSYPLTVDEYGPMLDIIERYYQDKGTFGIYEDGKLLVPSSSGNIAINEVVSDEIGDLSANQEENNPDKKNGRLVYVMQYKIPWIVTPPEDPDDPESCPEGYTGITNESGELICVIPNPPTETCDDGYVLNENNECVPVEEDLCAKLKAICAKKTDDCVNEATTRGACSDAEQCIANGICPELIPDCDIMQCLELNDYRCPDGMSPIILSEEEYEECIQEHTEQECKCVSNGTGDEPAVQCGNAHVFTFDQILGHTSVTMQKTSLHGGCGPCEKVTGKRYNPNLNRWENICFPDITKIDLPACNDTVLRPGCTSLSECCHDDNRGLFFGFPAGTNDLQCVDIGDYGQGPLAQLFITVLTSFLLSAPVEYQDGKWHCLECPNGMGSFFNNGASFWPWAATCNP